MLDEAHAVVQTFEREGDKDQKLKTSPEKHVIIYEGFLTQLITQKLNLSTPYYTHVRTALIRMGCIRQLKRGGGTAPSQWELIYEPTEEAFHRNRERKVPKQTKESQTERLITELSGRVADLEGKMGGVLDFLSEQFGTEPAPDEEPI